MLPFPAATTREEKIEIINEVKEKLLNTYKENILAIGAYGSIGLNTDGPYSDIELHVITKDGFNLKNHEFIYDRFKLEIGMIEEIEIIKSAKVVDESWAITAGVYINILEIYDPKNLFEELKKLPYENSDEAFRVAMKEFMVWEPFETVAKLRNNFEINNFGYIPIGAKELTWQTAKLIGLANKQYFSTRARTLEEAISMDSKPAGFKELASAVMEGSLSDKEEVYQKCESLWTGLNDWFKELGIDYKTSHLPF